ncbi:hypothetical protein GOP47_0006875 [Adiantum capillus-veneris]|uniref:Protein kinase domain-containing protein n=1 Tax=Adiantum capillus-veneris TaxID=13818 RepID=A0A9D4V442_ADICA|nr:hypothetical protein GOP47_0006875 [Adiantum capillus-veneris]
MPVLSITIILTPFLALIIILSANICPSQSFQFQHPSFSTLADLADIRIVYQDSSWYQGQDATPDQSGIWLTPNPIDVSSNKFSNIGKFIYKDLIQFKNSQNMVASFTSSFSFQIVTTGAYGTCGSGMTFFISHFDKAPNNSDGRFFGLFDPFAAETQKFFAVEFDTHTSSDLNDPSASHIGIDVNSLISLDYTDTSPDSSSSSTPSFYPQLYLYNNDTFTAWIVYDSLTNLIQVWMTNSSNSSSSAHPTSQALLELSYNLSTVFDDFMYVGFSATNKVAEDGMEGHVVMSWSFTSEDFKEPGIDVNVVVPIAIALPILFILGFVGIIMLLIKRKREKRMNCLPSSVQLGRESSTILLGSGRHCTLPRYSYRELKRSAHDFSEQSKIGQGGFSIVYRGTLADGSVVAIKRLKEGVRKEEEFSAEMNIISSIRHRHLLQLRGWCYEKGEAMLVYNYLSNGSLDRYLYGEKKGELQSETRLKILVGVASALEYLHGNLGECVLHRDVKAANVLLTEGFEPMLGDFGLARLVGHDEGAVLMTVAGTPGYVAPEVVYTGRFTDRADVYSFGVLALEMAYGRPTIVKQSSSLQQAEEEAQIVDYAWMLHQREQLMEALDPCMMSMVDSAQKAQQWRVVLHVALMCCNPSPECRPTMMQVYQALKGDTVLLSQPLPAARPNLYPTLPNLYPTFTDWPSISSASSVTSVSALSVKICRSEGGPSSTTSK